MKRVLLDTNVLVSFLTDRDLDQQEKAAQLLGAGAAGEVEAVVHRFVLFELAYVLQNLYQRPVAEVRSILEDLLAFPGVTVMSDLSWPDLLKYWPETFRDLADAVLAVVSLQLRCDAAATFHRQFARRLHRRGITSWWRDTFVPTGPHGRTAE